MNTWKIILAPTVFLAGCQPWSQQIAPAAPPMPYPTTAAPMVVGPPYVQGQPVFQAPPQGTPVYPPGSTVVPLPSQTPGSIFGPPMGAPVVGPAPGLPPGAVPPGAVVPPGAMVGPQPGVPVAPPGPANPIVVPVADEDLAWDQLVDVVSDYFKIAREQRVRRSGEAWTEGRIETAPLTGATVLEPHRSDSVGTFNRWESTFQSIRRRATVRVVPDANGYLVEVIVEKELEDLPKPEKATAGPASFDFDSEQQLPSKRLEEITRTHSSPHWIVLGRDPALEQAMLADIHARLTGITGHRSVFAQ
jgi:hypothetical protein